MPTDVTTQGIDYMPQILEQMKKRSQYQYGLSPADPVIKGQVDAYRTEQERAGQRTLQQQAEAASPYSTGVVRNQGRMINEGVGRNVGGFQAELMSRELANRRALDQYFESLGLQTEDRARYWDAVSSGLLG